MLSPQAWNAFLKTLEEPPPRTIFVLATTEAQKVLPTVVDRCHRFDFTPPDGRADRRRAAPRRRRGGHRRARRGARAARAPRDRLLPRRARHARAARRPTRGRRSPTEDVLAVLGVADAELLFSALDAIAARDAREALLGAARLVDTGPRPDDVREGPRGPRARPHGRAGAGRAAAGAAAHAGSRRAPGRAGRARRARRGRAAARPARAARWRPARNGADPRTQLELALVKAAVAGGRSVGEGAARPRRGAGGRAAADRRRPRPRRRRSAPPSAACHRAGRRRARAAAAGARARARRRLPRPSARRRRPIWTACATCGRPSSTTSGPRTSSARASSPSRGRSELRAGELTSRSRPGRSSCAARPTAQTYRECVLEALKAVTGQAPALAYELRELEALDTARRSAGGSAAPPLTEEELVARFVAEFDAEEIVPEAPPEETS